ncbi:MAG: hypothetical protein Q8Q32_00835, partial [bacterium]|nr:hypothetical protein [bacterium]
LITPTPAGTKDCYDFTHFGENSELIYESCMLGWHSRVRFSWFITIQGMEIDYSMGVIGSKNMFGCVGMQKKQYCILNKQYSKEEYEALRNQIIKQMNDLPYVDKQGRVYKYGEFFPIEASPYAYNETTAQLYFPLEQTEIKNHGYTWRDPAERGYTITKKGSELSDSFEFSDAVKNETVGCLHEGACGHGCSKAFRFVPAELAFYRQFKLPLPRLCSNCRHVSRVQMTNLPRLWKRACACGGIKSGAYSNVGKHFHGEQKCPNEFETSYAPDRPEIVYCESCYNSEVV